MYDHIIIDSHNLAYTVFYSPNLKEENSSKILKMNERRLFPYFIKNYLDTIKMLKAEYLKPDGEITLLFDNHHSREEIKKLLKPLKMSENRRKVNPLYKSKRKPESMEFYNSIEQIRYLMCISEPMYHTGRIPNLEADDLVKPVIDLVRETKPNATVLLVTNDSDWCRYLDEGTQYLPKLFDRPLGVESFKEKNGFDPQIEKVILYKVLYGDDADNIEAVFPEFDKETRKYILNTFDSTADFLVLGSLDDNLKAYSDSISAKLPQVKIAWQVLSAVPVSMEHMKKRWTIGRSALGLKDSMEKAMFEAETPLKTKGFSFGGEKIPRQTPNT